MAIDSLRAARRAALKRLKSFQALTDVVPASRIYGQAPGSNPIWPFIKWGSPTAAPRRASCLDGPVIRVAIHAYAGPRKGGARVIETAEDHASRIGELIARALDGHYGDLPDGVGRFEWTGSQLFVDDQDADSFHVAVDLRIRCSTV